MRNNLKLKIKLYTTVPKLIPQNIIYTYMMTAKQQFVSIRLELSEHICCTCQLLKTDIHTDVLAKTKNNRKS